MATQDEVIAFINAATPEQQATLLSAVGATRVEQFLELSKVQFLRDSLLVGIEAAGTVDDPDALRSVVASANSTPLAAPLFKQILATIKADIELVTSPVVTDRSALFQNLILLYLAVKS